jgi:hypothetical protein
MAIMAGLDRKSRCNGFAVCSQLSKPKHHRPPLSLSLTHSTILSSKLNSIQVINIFCISPEPGQALKMVAVVFLIAPPSHTTQHECSTTALEGGFTSRMKMAPLCWEFTSCTHWKVDSRAELHMTTFQ